MNANDSKLSINQRNAIMQNTAWSARNKAIAMQKLASRFDLSMRQTRHIVNYQNLPKRVIITILVRKLEPSEPLAIRAVKSYQDHMERIQCFGEEITEHLGYDLEHNPTPVDIQEIDLWHFGGEKYVVLADNDGLVAVCIVCPKNTALFVEHVPYALWITLFYRYKALPVLCAPGQTPVPAMVEKGKFRV